MTQQKKMDGCKEVVYNGSCVSVQRQLSELILDSDICFVTSASQIDQTVLMKGQFVIYLRNQCSVVNKTLDTVNHWYDASHYK